MKCPRCEKENNENEEICKYCGYDLKAYQERVRLRKEKGDIANSFVAGYNVFIVVMAILIFIGGIVIGQENSSLILGSWIAGIIFLVIINMLKNVVDELRRLNAKIK